MLTFNLLILLFLSHNNPRLDLCMQKDLLRFPLRCFVFPSEDIFSFKLNEDSTWKYSSCGPPSAWSPESHWQGCSPSFSVGASQLTIFSRWHKTVQNNWKIGGLKFLKCVTNNESSFRCWQTPLNRSDLIKNAQNRQRRFARAFPPPSGHILSLQHKMTNYGAFSLFFYKEKRENHKIMRTEKQCIDLYDMHTYDPHFIEKHAEISERFCS